MGDLKSCPFCGGKAIVINIEEGENQGGSCVCCEVCQASSNVEFGFKENFVDNWNRRYTKATQSAQGAETVTISRDHYDGLLSDHRKVSAALEAATALSAPESMREALEQIAYLRPVGPTTNKLIEKIEKIALSALENTPASASLPVPAQAGEWKPPEGWTLVPGVPTPEMLRAYKTALKRHIDALPDDVRLPGKRGLIIDDTIKAKVRFAAMLAAAPVSLKGE